MYLRRQSLAAPSRSPSCSPSCPQDSHCPHLCGTHLFTLFLNTGVCRAFKITRVFSVSALVKVPFGLCPFGVAGSPSCRGSPGPLSLGQACVAGLSVVWFSMFLCPPSARWLGWVGAGLMWACSAWALLLLPGRCCVSDKVRGGCLGALRPPCSFRTLCSW